MSINLIEHEPADVVLKRDSAMGGARRYVHHGRRQYTWRFFERWSNAVSLASLPAIPDTVANAIVSEADEGLALAMNEVSKRMFDPLESKMLRAKLDRA